MIDYDAVLELEELTKEYSTRTEANYSLTEFIAGYYLAIIARRLKLWERQENGFQEMEDIKQRNYRNTSSF